MTRTVKLVPPLPTLPARSVAVALRFVVPGPKLQAGAVDVGAGAGRDSGECVGRRAGDRDGLVDGYVPTLPL